MPTTETAHRRGGRRRTFGVAPYVPGRTTAEYVADGTLRAVEADDEIAALATYAAAHGLTVTGEPVMTRGGKRSRVTLSDGGEYVSRYLKAAVAELLPPELLIEESAAPTSRPTETAASHDPGPAILPERDRPAPPEQEPTAPPEPPEFVLPSAVTHAALERLRASLQPRSWDIAAGLWGAAGREPESIQAIALRFAATPGFVRMVAASVIHLATADVTTAQSPMISSSTLAKRVK